MKRAVFLAALTGCAADGSSPPVADAGTREDAAPAADGSALPCSGRALTQSGVLDLPLTSVHVTGTVTLGGQTLPLPAGATSRGRIGFSDGARAAGAALPSQGAASYDLWLAPGIYDVSFGGDLWWCAAGSSPLPCNAAVVKKAVQLTASGVLDLDAPPPVQIAGTLTLNGAAFPDGIDRGALAVGGLELALGTSGPARYQATVFAGHYPVVYRSHSLCDGGPLPCIDAVLEEDLALSSSGALDLDLGTVQVSGAVTLNGGPMPANAGGRGGLAFARAGGTVSAAADLGRSGPATYVATLVPGSYDVVYGSPLGGGDCGNLPLPCSGGTVKSQVALTTSGVLDVDVPAVTVTGTVKLAGAALPDATADRGRVTIGGVAQPLGATGPAQYQMMLIPGRYDVSYLAESGCAAAPMPCNGGILKAKQSFLSSGVFDIDIPVVQVTGAVTLNGAPLPDRAGDRGQILWDGTGAALGSSGAGQYRLRLLPGTYDVSYAPSNAGCDGSAFPCVGGSLKPGVALDHDGALDLDVKSIALTGALTLNGGALPAAAGELSFNSTPIAMLAPTYRATLIPGSYIIQYVSASGCAGPLPCTGEILFGCP
jgi:hypothetical protein